MRRLFSVEIVFVIGTFLTGGGGDGKACLQLRRECFTDVGGGEKSQADINFRLYMNLGILFSPGSDLTWETGSFSLSALAF